MESRTVIARLSAAVRTALVYTYNQGWTFQSNRDDSTT